MVTTRRKRRKMPAVDDLKVLIECADRISRSYLGEATRYQDVLPAAARDARAQHKRIYKSIEAVRKTMAPS